MILFILLLLVYYCEAHLVVAQYSSEKCSQHTLFSQLFINISTSTINSTSPNKTHCSSYVCNKRSTYFKPLNDSHILIEFCSDIDCVHPFSCAKEPSESIIVKYRDCIPNSFVSLFGTSEYYYLQIFRISDSFFIDSPSPSSLSPTTELPNHKNYIKIQMFTDQNCHNHSSNFFNYMFFPMHDSPVFLSVGQSIHFPQLQDDFRIIKKCNSTHFLQYVVEDDNPRVLKEVYVYYLKNGDGKKKKYGSCVPRENSDSSSSSSDVLKETLVGSTIFSCVNEDEVLLPNSTEYKKFFRLKRFYTPSCYGRPVEIVESKNGACVCGFGGEYSGCYSEYYDSVGRNIMVYQPLVKNPLYSMYSGSSDMSDTLRDDDMSGVEILEHNECNTNYTFWIIVLDLTLQSTGLFNPENMCVQENRMESIGTSSENHGTCAGVRYSFENDNQRNHEKQVGQVTHEDDFDNTNYYIGFFHSQSCEYMEKNPDEFELIKKQRNEMPSITFFHTSLCVSWRTTKFGIDPSTYKTEKLPISIIGKCDMYGNLLYDYYYNSDSCSTRRKYDLSQPSNVTAKKGNYCLHAPYGNRYDVGSNTTYFTFTCIPNYCNGVPQYEYGDKACNGKGLCESDGSCFCSPSSPPGTGWSGVNCEIPPYTPDTSGDEKDEDDKTLETVLTAVGASLGTLIPLSACFIGVCCICMCCCLLCFILFCVVWVCCCCCWVCCGGVCCFGFFRWRTTKLNKRLRKYNQLDDVDLLLKEQLLEKDTSIAHLRIDKNLFEIKFEEIEMIEILGQGGSEATVYKANWSGQVVAFKCFKTKGMFDTQDSFDDFETEVQLMASLSHPNIIRFFGASLKPPRVGIIMEFCENGELVVFLRKYRIENEGRAYDVAQKLRICREVISAFQYLHSRDIIHRDLKGENVLIDKNENSKLMDFGLSRLVEEKDKSKNKTKHVGTASFMAPEIIGGQYDNKCDSFSFSILVYAIFTEKANVYELSKDGRSKSRKKKKNESYSSSSNRSGMVSIELRVASDPTFRPSVEDLEFRIEEDTDRTPNEGTGRVLQLEYLKDIIVKCWSHEPTERYSFDDLARLFDDQDKLFLEEKNDERKNEEKVEVTEEEEKEEKEEVKEEVLETQEKDELVEDISQFVRSLKVRNSNEKCLKNVEIVQLVSGFLSNVE